MQIFKNYMFKYCHDDHRASTILLAHADKCSTECVLELLSLDHVSLRHYEYFYKKI